MALRIVTRHGTFHTRTGTFVDNQFINRFGYTITVGSIWCTAHNMFNVLLYQGLTPGAKFYLTDTSKLIIHKLGKLSVFDLSTSTKVFELSADAALVSNDIILVGGGQNQTLMYNIQKHTVSRISIGISRISNLTTSGSNWSFVVDSEFSICNGKKIDGIAYDGGKFIARITHHLDGTEIISDRTVYNIMPKLDNLEDFSVVSDFATIHGDYLLIKV